MEGIRICFPLTNVEEKCAEDSNNDDQTEAAKDLFSLNLDMGPVGKARLVVSHVNEVIINIKESNISVNLSVAKEYLRVPLSLRVSKFILNEDGSLHSQVSLYLEQNSYVHMTICLV